MERTGKIFVSYTFLFGFFASIYTLVPTYFDWLGSEILQTGLIVSISMLIGILLTYMIGRVCDKVHANYAVAIGQVLSGIPPLIYGTSTSPLNLGAATTIESVSDSFSAAYSTMMHDVFPKEESRRDNLTLNYSVGWLSSVVGYPFFGFLIMLVGYRYSFIFSGIGLILIALIPLKLIPPVKTASDLKIDAEKEDENNEEGGESQRLAVIVLIQFVLYFGLAVGSMFVFAYYLFTIEGVTIVEYALIISVEPLTIALLGISSQSKLNERNTIRIARYGSIMYLLFALLMANATNIFLVIIALIVKGIAGVIWFPAQQTVVFDLVPEGHRGSVFGIIEVLTMIAGAVGLLSGTIIADLVFLAAAYYLEIICILIVFLAYNQLLKEN